MGVSLSETVASVRVEHAGAEEDGADQDEGEVEHGSILRVSAILQSVSDGGGRVWLGSGNPAAREKERTNPASTLAGMVPGAADRRRNGQRSVAFATRQ